MKVSKSVLERVYDAFQSSHEDALTAGGSYLDPETNLQIINAFELPLWRWSVEKNGFNRWCLIPSDLAFLLRLGKGCE
jgi:DNA polymerase epsilon subunit 2